MGKINIIFQVDMKTKKTASSQSAAESPNLKEI